jgi:3'-phosphoadenosine 5'-phosphosulfate sulfotransferase (PAPS reductase)/FAD synthetase
VKTHRTTEEILAELREAGGETVALSFSTGRDSLATWLAMRDAGFRCVPIYFYLVPELEFVERTLAMYEDFFATPIVRLPHPVLEKRLHCCDYQDPAGYRTMYKLNWPAGKDYDELTNVYLREIGMAGAYTVLGVRAFDSVMRRFVMARFGEVRRKKRKAFPLAWWSKREVEDCIVGHGAPKSIDYELFGRSFDGLSYRYLKPIAEKLPNDYRRILTWFPLVEAELMRGEIFQ